MTATTHARSYAYGWSSQGPASSRDYVHDGRLVLLAQCVPPRPPRAAPLAAPRPHDSRPPASPYSARRPAHQARQHQRAPPRSRRLRPRSHRPAVIRAQLAFQAIYDYVDTLAEQPHANPIRNARQLHRALPAALNLASSPGDYYRHHAHRDDGGYLQAITNACRAALATLPSYPAVAGPAHRLAERIVRYQSLNLTQTQGSYHALARWASHETPPDTELRWWETAASAGSSLGIFALIATAAHPAIHPHEATAIERAYFPWIGSLHSLLDSLIDQPEDAATEQHNLIEHYASPRDTAARLRALAAESARRARALPRGLQHTMILAGMASHYLSAREAQLPHARHAKSSVLEAMGDLAAPTMFVLRLRRAAQTQPSGRSEAADDRYLC